MPMLAFGTMTMSNKGCKVSDAVEQWIRLGGRHIDMSLGYKTQPEAGKGINASGVPRKDVFLTTKIEGPIGYNATIDQVIKHDLVNVGLDYFDLLLIHWPCTDPKKYWPNKCGAKGKAARLETWRGLEYLKSQGKVRAIGVSNFNRGQVKELVDAGYKPAVNQVQWHLGYHNDTFLEKMAKYGVKVEAWAPLAGPTKSSNIPGVSLSDARLKAVASRYKASTAQIALQWSVKKGVTPVTATCVKDHAVADLTAFNFNLSKEDMTYLDALKENSTTSLLVQV
jgi:diketogulonate reductase-like aldo/keto reductase